MPTRRQLLRYGALAGVAAATSSTVLLTRGAAVAQTSPVLDPTTIPKYVAPLFAVPAMPPTRTLPDRDEYVVAARRFAQQMLPPGFPATQVFGFGSGNSPAAFSTPARTIEARVNRTTRVTWVNQLVSGGRFVPHLTPVDPTLHWANPPGGVDGRDSMPEFDSTPGPYRGPVPLVVHLHGSHVFDDSDGYSEAWYLPAASNIPNSYARVGSIYDQFRRTAEARYGVRWAPGNAVFQYQNDQRATTLWYHDHTLGMTRNTVYAGLAGMYLLRGGAGDLPPGVLPGPAPGPADPPGRRHYELPLVIQDKVFRADGSLAYPASRADFGDTQGPFIPETDVHPIWNPVHFGNAIVVNGRTWPSLNVEPRRYRFRVLNASGVRSYSLKIVSDPLVPAPAPVALPIWVIGADGGFLPAPASVESVTIGPAERLDVIVDFTGVAVGTQLYLSNELFADPATTGQVMRFVVVPLAGRDTSMPPAQLRLPARTPLGPATVTRQLSMNTGLSQVLPGVQINDLLGTVDGAGNPHPLGWHDEITETINLGATEVWELPNFTAVGHLIHLHLVQFEVLGRVPMGGGTATPPDPWETGTKDTLAAPPGQVTRIKSTFDRAGLYSWHCHIMDHEDNSMMRPYLIQ